MCLRFAKERQTIYSTVTDYSKVEAGKFQDNKGRTHREHGNVVCGSTILAAQRSRPCYAKQYWASLSRAVRGFPEL